MPFGDAVPSSDISIHAPRGGSDPSRKTGRREKLYFNPRSPWGERLFGHGLLQGIHGFQSTLPVGGATAYYNGVALASTLFQSTLPVGGATARFGSQTPRDNISIHAPRGGSDR